MAHLLYHFNGVEVMAFCYSIAVEALHKLSWSVLNFKDCVLLILGDFLSQEAKLGINFPTLSITFMSDKLLPKRLYQALLELILDWRPALCRIMNSFPAKYAYMRQNHRSTVA